MSPKSAFLASAVVAALCIGSSEAQAASIVVANPSFEVLPPGGLPIDSCGTGCFYDEATPIPGWVTSISGQTGQFQPGVQVGDFNYFNSIPDGITVAYSNGGTISQVVGATAVDGATYTLTVDLGFRKDVPDPGIVDLMVGGATVLATGTALPGSGDWSLYTASYTATAADAGKPIEILLSTPGAQGDWDNVNLQVAGGVPEPATWAMMLIGFLGLGGVMRTRRRNPLEA